MASDSTLSTFTANDGDNLAVQDWPLEPGVPVRGVVLIVHGLGEHAGRYGALAEQLYSPLVAHVVVQAKFFHNRVLAQC